METKRRTTSRHGTWAKTFLLSVLMLCAANAFGQKQRVTLTNMGKKSITLKEAFAQIEKQTDLSVDYAKSHIDDGRKLSTLPKSGELEDVMNALLEGTGCECIYREGHVIIRPMATPNQEKGPDEKVQGIVKDESGFPVIGASIRVKGTTNGSLTGMDGDFHLADVKHGDILEVSFVGYHTQSIACKGQPLDIVLKEDVAMLDEVVVVGYGTQKKVNLTGAVSTVNQKTLESRPVTKITQALQGTVANLNISSSNGGAPGATQDINIRGYSGLGTTSSPLIVIDGIQGGSLNYLDPDDVESISVLKDAASASIYGSSAPFGAILITTKRGAKNTKARITYSNSFRFAQPINLPKMANSLDFATIYNEAADNAGVTRPFTDENLQRIKDYQAGLLTDETIANPTRDEWYTWTGHANNDWFDIFFKDVSFSQQHNIGVSGGTEKTNYYVGAGYNQTGGLYEFGDDVYKRYNVRANLSTEITKWLNFSLRSTFSRASSDTPDTYSGKTGGNYMHQISRKWPTAAVRNPNGEYSYPSDIRLMTEGGRSKGESDNVILTGEFVIKPLPGWDITANYTYDGLYYNGSGHVKTLYVTNPSGATMLYSGTSPNSFSRTSRKTQRHVINAFTSYEKSVGKHYFKVMVGFMQELYDYLQQYSSNNNLYSDDLPSLTLTYGSSPSTSDDAYQLATRAGFGRINYNYKEIYLLEFNARYDGTSRFLRDERFKFFPGVSAGWIVSKEKFWEPITDIVNHTKFRVSYAVLGDQSAMGYYPFYPSMGTTAPTGSNWIFADGREAYVTNPGLVNSDLTWISTATLNFGVDLAFFRNRLNASFDWYKRTGKNYVGPSKKLPAILGTTLPNTNDSEIQTTGWEVTIGWRDQIRDFNYNVNFVLSDYTGKVTKYTNPTGLHTTWYEGKKMGELWGYETYGLFQSEEEIASAPSQSKIAANWYPGDVRYVDLNGDGVIDWGDNTLANPGDKKIIGNTTPRYQFGLNLQGDYKGWDFGLFFQGVGKRDAWLSSNIFWGLIDGQWQSCVLTPHLDRWTEDNPNGYFPRYYLNSSGSKNMQTQTGYLQNAAYIRLKNLQIGYSIPQKLLNKIDIERLRVFVSVDNLATISSMPESIDPEFSATDGKVYPLQRTWSVGLNLTL